MSIEFLVDAADDLQSMKEDLDYIEGKLEETGSWNVLTLQHLREEAHEIRDKAKSINDRVFETSMKLGVSSSRVKKYLQKIIPLASEVEKQAKLIIREINDKDFISKLFAPVQQIFVNIAEQMRNLLSRLRDKLPPSIRRKLLPSI